MNKKPSPSGNRLHNAWQYMGQVDKQLVHSKLGKKTKKTTDDLIDTLSGLIKDLKNKVFTHPTKVVLMSVLLSSSYYAAKHIDGYIANYKHEETSEITDIGKKSAYRDHNPDFFNNTYIEKPLAKEEIAPGVELIRDVGLTFYIVQKGDTKEKIRKKLIKIPEFSYLKQPEYAHKISGFNVPEAILQKKIAAGGANTFLIPIPLDSDVRTFSVQEFSAYARQGIDIIKKDPKYGPILKELLKDCTEDKLIAAMVAFARSETASEWSKFTSPIGATEFHRREERYTSFSFSPYHILMEKNADGKTPGPGLKAREDLKLTEGQSYHPANATALFFAYFCNKINHFSSVQKMSDIFPLTPKNITTVSKLYNGSRSYAPKLQANYLYAMDVFGIEDEVWKTVPKTSHISISKHDFSFIRTTASGQNVYKYTIKSGGSPEAVKKHFQKHYPSIEGHIQVVNESGTPYTSGSWIQPGTKVYIKTDG